MTRHQYFNLFHEISAEAYELLTGNLKTKSFKKGEVIIVPGEVQRALFFVNKGIQMSYFESQEKIHVMAFTYYPDLCAIPDSFSFQQPSKCFLSCITDSEMDYLPYETLQELFDRSGEIERLCRKMTEAVLAGIINRHIELHSLTIEERFKAFCNRSPHLLNEVPHKYLASYLGINPTNFSKLFNKVKI